MIRVLFSSIFWLCALSQSAGAVNTSTLPKGIRSPSLRVGYISGLGDYFSEDGSLYALGDLRSVRVNAEFLQNSSVEARNLVNALNSISGQNLGSQVDLGTVLIDTKPEVKYYALTFGYGITNRWTVGGGVPVINYTNDISVAATRGNRDAYAALFPGISAELDAAWSIDLVKETHKTIAQKGYKPLSNRNENFLGDAQLASMYHFENQFLGGEVMHRAILNLPTGPAYDPDDLMAPNQFGRTFIENSLSYSHPTPLKRVDVGTSLAYSQPLPDQVNVRVPKDERDSIPDASQKDKVDRQMGMSFSALVDATWKMTDTWAVMGGYQWWTKSEDKFSGNRGLRYDLLSDETEAASQSVIFGLSADTVAGYLRTQTGIPMIASISHSMTVAGVNTERKDQTELTLMLFF